MPSLRRSVSSLGALATFEAAARLASFTRAAAELGVTQAAVSRQIKLLETDLNAPLFVRAHRRVALTPAGAALAGTLSTSFDRIAEMIETVRQPLVPSTVAIGATLAFTHFWLLPRLAGLRADHPDIHLRLVADDAPTDLRRDRLDIVIRYGKPPFEDARSLASHSDEVFPVCSPILLHRLGITAEGADIARMPLITAGTVDPTWLSWKLWARGVGLGPDLGRAADRSRLRFNHYADSIQATMMGEGVALGWGHLLSAPLAEGRLVRLGPRSLVTAERYHVLVPLDREPSGMAHRFLDWIAGRFAAEA